MAGAPNEPLPLARHVFVDTDDPQVARTETSKIFAPHTQSPGPGSGPFRALHHHARLANLSFNYIRYEPGLIIRSGPMMRYYLLLIPQAGRCQVGYGEESVELRPGHVAVVNPLRPLRMTWMDSCAQCVVKVDRADLEARLGELLGEVPLRPLLFDFRQTVPRALCAGLVDFAMLAFRDLDLDKPVLSSRLAEDSTERLFLSLMLGDLPNSYSEALSRPRSRVAPYYVKRVEEFIRLHAGSAIGLDDMVAVSGVSKRALFRGFRAFRGMGPMAYLKSVRLESAHAELTGPGPERRSVTEVANAWGFTHLGNFARDYRRRFGRRPSESLRGRR